MAAGIDKTSAEVEEKLSADGRSGEPTPLDEAERKFDLLVSEVESSEGNLGTTLR